MGLQETDLLIRERPTLPIIQQKVFAFSVVDGHVYYYPIEPELEKAKKKGFQVFSPSKIESILSEEPPEEQLSHEQLLEKALRITFGILAHRFYTFSSVATICGGEPKKGGWDERQLEMVLRTWKPKDIKEVKETLDQVGIIQNVYDYEKLWEKLVNQAFEEKPFTDTIPLPWIFPASGDRLPTPQEIITLWNKKDLPDVGKEFARACQHFQKFPDGVEFLSWNRRAVLFEASILAYIHIFSEGEELKLIVPMRMDELWFQPRVINNGHFWQPTVIDLKTSLPFKDLGTAGNFQRPQIAPLLYRLAAEQIYFNSPWQHGKPKSIFLGNNAFDSAAAANLNKLGRGREQDHLPPRCLLRTFKGKEGTIVDKEFPLLPNWREKLLEQLFEAQEKLKKGKIS